MGTKGEILYDLKLYLKLLNFGRTTIFLYNSDEAEGELTCQQYYNLTNLIFNQIIKIV